MEIQLQFTRSWAFFKISHLGCRREVWHERSNQKSDSGGQDGLRPGIRLHPDQGRAGGREPSAGGAGELGLGEPPGGQYLDLQPGRHLAGPAGLLPEPFGGCAGEIRGGAGKAGCPWLFGYDARLYAL